MHRSISTGDVKEYSTGARVKDVQLEKEEDIEYRSGHLYHSSGSTTVKMAKPQQRFAGRHTTLQEGPLNEDLTSSIDMLKDIIHFSMLHILSMQVLLLKKRW